MSPDDTLRSLFAEYYPPTPAEFESLWKTGGISLDANALIDLFRVSEEAASDVLSVLSALGDRVWVSHQAALEFHQALPQALAAESTNSGEILKQLEETEKALEKRPMMLPTRTTKKLAEVMSEVRQEVNGRRERLNKNMTEGALHRQLSAVLAGKIGRPYSEEAKKGVFSEGKVRYAKQQPPGFADREKKGSAGDDKLYGDLLVWKQCVEHFSSKSIGFIFVTGEKKPDWVRQSGGRTLGPHPELVSEYFTISKQRFHLYDLSNFLTHGSKHVEVTIKEASIREMATLSARLGAEAEEAKKGLARLTLATIRNEELRDLKAALAKQVEMLAAHEPKDAVAELRRAVMDQARWMGAQSASDDLLKAIADEARSIDLQTPSAELHRAFLAQFPSDDDRD